MPLVQVRAVPVATLNALKARAADRGMIGAVLDLRDKLTVYDAA